MDWAQIITALGGGPMAVAVAGLAVLFWSERARSNDLVERLIKKSSENLADAMKREMETLTTLKEIAASLRGGK